MADRYVRMNILESGGDDAKKTLDDLAARARLLEAESPDLKITADDTKASATLKDLQLKIEILNRMRAEVSFETKGDETAKAKLLDVDAKLRELSEKVAKPSIEIKDTDKAERDLIKIKLLLDSIHDKKVKLDMESSSSGFLSKLFSIFGGNRGGGGGGGSAAEDAEGSSGVASGLLSALGGANNEYFGAGIAGLIALAASVTPALVPAGIGGLVGGAGGFGIYELAKNAASQLAAMRSSLTGITGNTASDKKQRAALQAQIAAFERSHAPELGILSAGTSIVHEGESEFTSALTSPEYVMGRSGNRTGPQAVAGSSFLSGIQSILSQIGGFVKSIGPGLGEMFRSSLPFLKMFVGFLETLAKLLMPAFTESMKEMQPYIPILSQGFGYLAQGIADFIKDLGPGMKDGAIIFKAVMDAVKGILIGVAYAADGLAKAFEFIGHYVMEGIHEWLPSWREFQHQILSVFDGIEHGIESTWDTIYDHTIGFALAYITKLSEIFQGLLHDVSSIFDTLRHDVAEDWDWLLSYLYRNLVQGTEADFGVLKHWFDDVTGAMDTFRHGVAHIWDLLWNDAKNAATQGVHDLGTAVHGIINAFERPVKFVVDNVWDKLAGIWNHISGIIHVGFKLPVLHMATGGRIPGYGGGDTVPALLERGEVVVDKDRASTLAPVFKAAGVPGFSGGGIVGDIGGFFSSIGKDLMGWITKPLSFIESHVFGSVEGMLGDLGNTGLGNVLRSLVKTVIGTLTGTLHNVGASTAPYTGAYGPGVTQWTSDVLRVLAMLGLPKGDLGTVLAQMMTESGGNPNAINLSDSNAASGDPSRGLMQVIMSTFEAYRSRSLPNDIYNPMSNIYAGLNYAIHRYGSSWLEVLGHGHGYANGGMITEPIAGIGLMSGARYSLGEAGPEWVTPASHMYRGGGDTYYITPPDSATNPDAYGLALVQAIRNYKKHHGNQPTGIG